VLDKTKEDIESVAKMVASALEGLEQVSFGLDFVIDRNTHGAVTISSVVTLWFGHEFSKKVHGGEDVQALAKSCREIALQRLAKIREIAEANRGARTK